MDDIKETGWSHVAGDKIATLSTSERKWIKTIERLKEDYPDEVEIRYVNEDGSLYVRLPADWLRIRPKKKNNMTPEQIAAAKERLENARRKRLAELNGSAAPDGV